MLFLFFLQGFLFLLDFTWLDFFLVRGIRRIDILSLEPTGPIFLIFLGLCLNLLGSGTIGIEMQVAIFLPKAFRPSKLRHDVLSLRQISNGA